MPRPRDTDDFVSALSGMEIEDGITWIITATGWIVVAGFARWNANHAAAKVRGANEADAIITRIEALAERITEHYSLPSTADGMETRTIHIRQGLDHLLGAVRSYYNNSVPPAVDDRIDRFWEVATGDKFETRDRPAHPSTSSLMQDIRKEATALTAAFRANRRAA